MSNVTLNVKSFKGWKSGLSNLLSAEFKRWETKEWYLMGIMWVGIIGFSMIQLLAEADADIRAGLALFGFFAGIFPMINVVIIMQDEIVGHRETGTMAWILSKPVSRSAYILSKLIANSFGVLVAMVLAPGIVVYLEIILFKGEVIPIVPYLFGLGVLALSQFYFLVLTLMLGVFFKNRGGVIGIPLILGFGFTFLQGLPLIGLFHPFGMFFPSIENPLFVAVILGDAVETWMPLISTIIISLIFVAVTLYKFNREEF